MVYANPIRQSRPPFFLTAKNFHPVTPEALCAALWVM